MIKNKKRNGWSVMNCASLMKNIKTAFKQLISFGYHQALCCIFPVVIFLTLAISQKIPKPILYRYDFILIICLLTQYLMCKCKLETIHELKVITIFHLIGLALEIFKVKMGSWAYPEPAWLKIGGVPLYSGFMYASIGSYICQSWRRFNLKIEHWPKLQLSLPLCILIYLNFFTHHFFIDLRWYIMILMMVIFYKTKVKFIVNQVSYSLPMVLSFFLIGFFIWIAENISTFFGAWVYPNQSNGWQLVHFGKISSWFLLVIISIIIVAQMKLKHPRELHNHHYATLAKEQLWKT